MPDPAPDPAPVTDDLRRRLYRPGADDEDLRRYLATRSVPAPQPEPDAPAPSRRSRARAVGALLVVGAAVLAVVAIGTRPDAATPSPSASSRPRQVLQDVGRGRAVDVADGEQSSPSVVVTQLDGAPLLGRRVDGRGTAVVALGPAADAGSGRAVVAVVADSDAPVTWRALVDDVRRDWTTQVRVVAEGRAASPTRPVPPSTFPWTGSPPTAVAVLAPAGVRWAVVYAASAGAQPTLR